MSESAQWIEAWSTLAAALFAAIAAIFAYRAYRKETRIETRLLDAEERSQASKVAAWIGIDPRENANSSYIEWLIIRNASEVPIYNVTCVVYMDNRQVAATEPIAVVPPSAVGVTADVPGDAFAAIHALQDREMDVRDLPVGISFSDASGAEWERFPDGELILGRRAPARG